MARPSRGRAKVIGQTQVEVRMRRMEKAATSDIADEIGLIAEDVRAEGFRRSPYRSGYLRSRLRARKLPGRRDVQGSAREVIDDAEYALFVHEGTARSKAQPFLREAAATEGPPRMERRVGERMEAALRRESL